MTQSIFLCDSYVYYQPYPNQYTTIFNVCYHCIRWFRVFKSTAIYIYFEVHKSSEINHVMIFPLGRLLLLNLVCKHSVQFTILSFVCFTYMFSLKLSSLCLIIYTMTKFDLVHKEIKGFKFVLNFYVSYFSLQHVVNTSLCFEVFLNNKEKDSDYGLLFLQFWNRLN